MPANDYVRDQFARYASGLCTPDHKRRIREYLIQKTGSDELATTASHWLGVQRANSIACWPYQGRTRAWNPIYCHKPAPIPQPCVSQVIA